MPDELIFAIFFLIGYVGQSVWAAAGIPPPIPVPLIADHHAPSCAELNAGEDA